MVEIKRTVKIVTEQKINPNKAPPQEGFPMRDWSIEIHILNEETGQLVTANCFEKAVYQLHPTFGKKARQIKSSPPFRVAEEGWGEFDMTINVTAINKGETFEINHDLNFSAERYEGSTDITFTNPKPDLVAILRQSGSIGDAASGATSSGKADTGKRRARANKNVDMEKLAEGLQRLDEESLLHVVQLVHDFKSPESYAKNDVENGEFHVDLFTLPDNLVKMLWDYAESKNAL